MTIRTIDELVEALGGPSYVAEWAGTELSAISNWKRRGFIPQGWHLRMWIEVRKRGLDVDPSLFEVSEDDAKFLLGEEGPPKPPKRGNGRRPHEAVAA